MPDWSVEAGEPSILHQRSLAEWHAYVEGFEAAARQLERFEEAKVPVTAETLRTTVRVLRRIGYVPTGIVPR